MEQSETLIRILLTVVFGVILGIETETRHAQIEGKENSKVNEKSRVGGIRTYTILSLVGGISGLLFNANEKNLSYLIFLGVIVLVSAAYILNVQLKEAFGMTTEIAIFITFILGFLTTSNLVPIVVNIFILVILAFFLSQKRGFGEIIYKIQHDEFTDVIKFGLITAVILPILPNQIITIQSVLEFLEVRNNSLNVSQNILNMQLFNPFNMWLIVVVITGINLTGQLLSQIVGHKRGILVSGLLGGLLSSTSTLVAFASSSRKASKKEQKIFAGSGIIANSISLPAILIILSVSSPILFTKVAPVMLAMFAIGIIYGINLIGLSNLSANHENFKVKYQHFSLSPAIKFVLIVIVISILIQLGQLSGSHVLTIILTAGSGILGMDPPTIAIGNLVQNKELTLELGALIFFITNYINFIAKIFYSKINGGNDFFKYITIGLIITSFGILAILI